MTAWTKLAVGLAAVSVAGGIWLASVLWAGFVAVVETAGFWLTVVAG